MIRHVTAARNGAIAVAAGILLAGLAATSAVADDMPETPDDDSPVIVIDRTEFVAGGWEDGFTVTGSGFIPNEPGHIVYGRIGPDTSFSPAEEFETDDNGAFEIHVDPWEPATADSPDQPAFAVQARQLSDGTWLTSDWVPLTITAPVETEVPTVPVAPAPADVAPAAAAAAAPAAPKQQLAETGFDGTIGLVALALIASGAAVVVLRRRTASASR
ncbi:hypothetical protein [Agromyces subbeticus]|uniref:hypothetical protein n=1 Tax=Agromyces subbeticus TaxID=293890 RepID=UPI0003B70B20|nr:hypothetical protein [Agromyces subbeticus]